jgi:hypothetical protein
MAKALRCKRKGLTVCHSRSRLWLQLLCKTEDVQPQFQPSNRSKQIMIAEMQRSVRNAQTPKQYYRVPRFTVWSFSLSVDALTLKSGLTILCTQWLTERQQESSRSESSIVSSVGVQPLTYLVFSFNSVPCKNQLSQPRVNAIAHLWLVFNDILR